MYSLEVYIKSFGGQKGGSLEPPRTPSAYGPGGYIFWTGFENLVAKGQKINDRVGPILVAIRNWNDVICLSRSEKVTEFAQCVSP